MIERGTTLSAVVVLDRGTTVISERIKPESIVWLDLRPKLREFVDYLVTRSGQWTTIYDARGDGIGEPNFHSLWGELKNQLPREWADRFLQSTWVNPEYGGRRYKGYRLAARLVDEDTLGKQGSDVPQAAPAAPQPIGEDNTSGTQEASLESLALRKSETLRSRGVGRPRGAKSVKVAKMLAEGKSILQIQEMLGLSDQEFAKKRRTLRGWGIKVPFTERERQMQDRKKLPEELKKPHSDGEIQEFLGMVTRRFLFEDKGRENPILASVAHTAWDAGFHFPPNITQLFVESLRRAGVPVGELPQVVKSGPQRGERRLLFIAAQHTARAQTVFLEDPNLQRFRENPVTQVCGHETQLPTTTKLIKKQGYRIILREVYVVPLEELLKGCPIPVFRIRSSNACYYPEDEEDRMQKFIADAASRRPSLGKRESEVKVEENVGKRIVHARPPLRTSSKGQRIIYSGRELQGETLVQVADAGAEGTRDKAIKVLGARLTGGEIYVLAFVLKQPLMQEQLAQLGIALSSEEKRRIDGHLYDNYQSKRFGSTVLKVLLGNLNSKLEELFTDPEGVTKENSDTPALSWLTLLGKAHLLTEAQKDELLRLVREIGRGVSNLRLSPGPS